METQSSAKSAPKVVPSEEIEIDHKKNLQSISYRFNFPVHPGKYGMFPL